MTINIPENIMQYNQSQVNDLFILACSRNNIDEVRYLLTNKQLPYRADVDANNSEAFLLSCYYNHLNIVRYLIESDEIINNIKIEKDGHTGLMNACYYNSLDVIKYLLRGETLSENIDINPENERDFYDYICEENRLDIVEYILNEYINDSNSESICKILLQYGIIYRNEYVIEMLQEKINFDINNHIDYLYPEFQNPYGDQGYLTFLCKCFHKKQDNKSISILFDKICANCYYISHFLKDSLTSPYKQYCNIENHSEKIISYVVDWDDVSIFKDLIIERKMKINPEIIKLSHKNKKFKEIIDIVLQYNKLDDELSTSNISISTKKMKL